MNWNLGLTKAGLFFGLPLLALIAIVVYLGVLVPDPLIKFFTGKATDDAVVWWEYAIFWGVFFGLAWVAGALLRWKLSNLALKWFENNLRNSKIGVIVNPLYGRIAAADPSLDATLVWVLNRSTGTTKLHIVKFDPADEEGYERTEADQLLVAGANTSSATEHEAVNVPRFLCLEAGFTYADYLEYGPSNYEARPDDFPGENLHIQQFIMSLVSYYPGLMDWYPVDHATPGRSVREQQEALRG